jgi:Asp-tRNA(Asn)/Glu-tRNA(Gln) amidotransferase A subunit family amidase
LSVVGLAERLQTGELSPREAVQSYLDRIDRIDSAVNSYITVRAEEALAEADALEGAEERGPLWGVPVAVKDMIDVAGTRTTAASRILADNVAAHDAETVERLKTAGAVLLGKLNTHEFAFGAMTTSPHFGPAHNPWSLDRICGGSSGGSGAAMAADLAAGTLGTDSAGSVRIPACFCGVTGLRPSTGLVSNRGVVPVSWSIDAVGPVARSAEDCAVLLDVIAGTSTELDGGVEGLRIGVVDALFDRSDTRIAAVVQAAVDELVAQGAAVEPTEVPLLEEAGTINQLVMLPEATSVHLPWLRERLTDYGPDVRARLLAGLLLPPTAYVTGLRARRWFTDGIRELFERFDLLAAPAMPITAPALGEDSVEVRGETFPYRVALIPFNSPWSLAGLPAASLPCGFVDGLPVGLALVGGRHEDGTVLRAAHAFQQSTDWHERRPAVESALAGSTPMSDFARGGT